MFVFIKIGDDDLYLHFDPHREVYIIQKGSNGACGFELSKVANFVKKCPDLRDNVDSLKFVPVSVPVSGYVISSSDVESCKRVYDALERRRGD